MIQQNGTRPNETKDRSNNLFAAHVDSAGGNANADERPGADLTID